MSDLESDLLTAFELHSTEQIRAVLDAGFDARSTVRGKPAIAWLTEMYARSDRFPACLRIMLEAGASLDDPVVTPVLLDDAAAVTSMLQADRALLAHRTTMVSAFTPLVGASLLHVAAEYCNANAARALIEAGADVHSRAAVDASGMNGHTPLFHTVNSIQNLGEPVMRLLLAAGADVTVRLQGVVWGAGFEWETTMFDVTPVSYAQLGLLPQVHRTERDCYANIALLLAAAGRTMPPMPNIPNRYLYPKRS